MIYIYTRVHGIQAFTARTPNYYKVGTISLSTYVALRLYIVVIMRFYTTVKNPSPRRTLSMIEAMQVETLVSGGQRAGP